MGAAKKLKLAGEANPPFGVPTSKSCYKHIHHSPSQAIPSTFFLSLLPPLVAFSFLCRTMLSRACLRGFGLQSLPKTQAYQLARRSVTTDAASSHAEKDDVPDVRFPNCYNHPHRDTYKFLCRRMISLSKSSSPTRASRLIISILLPIPSTPPRRS